MGYIWMQYSDIAEADYTILEKLTDDQIYDLVTRVIEHYRKSGFPYFKVDSDKIKRETKSLVRFDTSKIELPDRQLQQGMLGLATCNMFHPEMYSVHCKNAKSPMDVFLDDKLFRTAITKRIKHNDRHLDDSCIRRTLTAFGAQAVSNFRPTIAKWMYQKYCPSGGKVLDPCMGYGGRLMGAFCSHIGSYVGVDPNPVSITGNYSLYKNLAWESEDGVYPEMKFCVNPFEDYAINTQYDLVFTSPPYFNIERYSDEETQSYKRYPTYPEWKEKFLTVLITKSYNCLKRDGYLALNVGKPIDEDTRAIGTQIFGSEPEVYYMRLSKLLGQGDKSTVSHKLEPIFIWKK